MEILMIEIERRFLVPLDVAKKQANKSPSFYIEQTYLPDCGKWQIRSRMKLHDGKRTYIMTMKRKNGHGSSIELEETTTSAMHTKIRSQTGMAIEKSRTCHKMKSGHVIELDIFHDESLIPGYAIAEIEVESMEDKINIPDWFGEEITGRSEFSNAKIFKRMLERANAVPA